MPKDPDQNLQAQILEQTEYNPQSSQNTKPKQMASHEKDHKGISYNSYSIDLTCNLFLVSQFYHLQWWVGIQTYLCTEAIWTCPVRIPSIKVHKIYCLHILFSTTSNNLIANQQKRLCSSSVQSDMYRQVRLQTFGEPAC